MKFLKFELGHIPYILLFLLPAFLISGPFLSDAAVIIISIFFLIFHFNEFKKNFSENKFYIFFLIFYFYLLFCSFVSQDMEFSFKSTLPYIRFFVFIIAFSFFFQKIKKNNFFYFLFTLLLILLIDSLVQKITGTNLIGFEQFHPARISSLFRDQLILGSFTIKLLPILLGVLYLSNIKNKKTFEILSVLSSLLLILLSGEKSALILIILFFIIYLFFLQIKLIYKFLYVLLISCVAIVALMQLPLVKKRVFIDGFNNSGKGKYIYSRVHDSNYKTAINIYKKYNIFGSGPNTFRKVCKEKDILHDQYGCSTHPHNYYLQLLSETGIIGFLSIIIFYIFIMVIFFELILKKIKKKYINYSLLYFNVSLILNFLPIAPSGNFFNNWNAIFYTFSIGCFLSIINKNIKENSI